MLYWILTFLVIGFIVGHLFSFNKALCALMLLTVGLIAVALHLAEVSVIHVVARRTAWVG